MYTGYFFYSLLFLVAFTFGQGALNANVYNKQLAFGIVFLVMIVIALIQSFTDKKISTVKIVWGDVFIGILLIIYLYFSIGTHNNLDFTLPIFYFLFYCFMRSYIANNRENTVRVLSQIIPVVILLHIIISSLQFCNIIPAFHNYFPVGSTFGNPDMLGAYLAILFPFCYMGTKRKIFRYIVLALGIVLLLLLQARTAIVATAVAGILYLLLSKKITSKQFLWGTVPFIAGIALLVWWHPASVCGRLFIWYMSLLMIIEKPMGWGLYAFEKHFPEFQANYIANHPNIPDIFNPDVVHSSYNEFFNIGVTLGIGGLLCFILLVAFILMSAHKSRSPFLFPLCSFLIVSMSYFPFKIVPLVIIGIVLTAYVINSAQIQSVFAFKIRKSALFLIPMLFCVTYITISNRQNYRKWQQAVVCTQNDEQWDISSMLFADIYPAMSGNGRFLITRADLQYQMGDTLASLSSMQEADFFFCDITFLGNLAHLYEETRQWDKAKQIFEKAVNMAPGQFNAAYEQILFLQRIGNEKEAYDLALKLYEKPVKSSYYADPYIIKARLRKFIQSYQN